MNKKYTLFLLVFTCLQIQVFSQTQPLGCFGHITASPSFICYGGNTAISTVYGASPAAPYSFKWFAVCDTPALCPAPINTYQPTPSLVVNVSPSLTTTYTSVISNNSGCQLTQSTVVTVDRFGIQVTYPAPGTMNAQVVQGSYPPYSYYWSDGTQGPVDVVSIPGNYSLIVSDVYGCSSSRPVSPEFSAGLPSYVSSQDQFSIRPNPSDGACLFTTGTVPGIVEVSDILGNSLGKYVLPANGQFTVNAGEYPAGVYFCRLLRDGKPVQVRKWVIQR